MKIHEVKIQERFADAIAEGRKRFEIRKNDRAYQTGDVLRFRVVEDGTGVPSIRTQKHPMDGQFAEISYVLSGWGLKNGYVALGIREVERERLKQIKEGSNEHSDQ